MWLFSNNLVFRRVRRRPVVRRSKKNYLEHKEHARNLVLERIQHFNQIYNFSFKRIAIRNQRTRWGSCSKKGNLNFNYRIALLPAPLADYIIVHELCHLGEFNHAQKFWQLVARAVPEYRAIRNELRKIGKIVSVK